MSYFRRRLMIIKATSGTNIPLEYIKFADFEVERICVENWGDGNGITLEQVESITSLNSKFRSNTLITEFSELSKFKSLTSLNYLEFQGCSSLKSINIPCNISDSPNTGYGTFKDCIELENVIFDNDNIVIGNYAFSGCSKLRSIKLPNNTTEIRLYAFYKCSSLEEIQNWEEISNKIESISSRAFESTNLSYDLRLPNLKTLGSYAFSGTKIRKVYDLGSITKINRSDSGIFGTNIELLILPETLTEISAWGLVMPTTFTTLVCKAIVPPTFGVGNNLRNADIYVPDDSVEAYKTATGWVAYASRIHPLSEYVEE